MMQMKKIIIKFILMAIICSGSTEVYNWNVKTVEQQQQGTGTESATDFGDELKVQSALNNELQRDLLKISGKANPNYNNDNNNVYYENLKKFKYDVHNEKGAPAAAVVEHDIKKMHGEEYGTYYEGDKRMLFNEFVKSSTEMSDKQPHLNQYKHIFADNDNNEKEDGEKGYQHLKQKTVKQEPLQYDPYIHHIMHQHQYQIDQSVNKANENEDSRHNQKDRLSNYKYELLNEYNTVHGKADGKSRQHHDHHEYDSHSSTNNNENEISKKPEHQNIVNSYTKYHHRHQNHDKKLNHQYDFSHNDKQDNDENTRDDEDNTDNENYQLMSRCPLNVPEIENFLGTNLFGWSQKKCLSMEDIQLLTIRKDFESLIPKDLPQCLLNDRMITTLMNYFYVCHQLITTMTTEASKELTQRAFLDTLGGYLNFYLVPVSKYSYYAGQASLEAVESILRLHQQCKNLLNTNGSGWKTPMKDVLKELKTVRIEPLHIEGETSEEHSSCMHLNMDTDQNETDDDEMLVPLPKLESEDDNGHLGNVWLPFRRKRTFDLKWQGSAYVIVKFYTTLSNCFQFENINQDFYNRQFKEWLLENIQIHLSDDVFYPGLGSVLRIFENLKRTKDRNYDDNLWAANYEDHEEQHDGTREKKSYPTSSDRNPKEFWDIFKKSKHYQETPKSWLKQKYTNDKQVQNKHRKYDEKENDRNQNTALENPWQHQQQQLTDEQIKLAVAIMDERARSVKEKPQLRVLEMSPFQMIVIIVPVVALVIVIIICCLKLKKKKKKQVTLRESGGGKRRSNKGEETQLLNAHSKSVVHGSIGSSSSSVLCLADKCFPHKRSGPAIIETTSLDYSSSEGEEKNTKKPSIKTVKIDEKSKKTTASLNGKDKATTKGKYKKPNEIAKK